MKFAKWLVCGILVFLAVTYTSTSIAKEKPIVADRDISIPTEVSYIDSDVSGELSTKQSRSRTRPLSNLKQIVLPFYTKCLTVNRGTNVAQLMGNLLADNFQSIGSTETEGKADLIQQVQGFWKLIPDLKWEVQEMLQDGNRVIVRSIGSGTPKGDFMGLQTDGTKSFKIMTIDIHTVQNGKIARVYHVEDWATAMRQLQG